MSAAALALDVSLPGGDYYRPDTAHHCRNGFLPLGEFGSVAIPDEIVTSLDNVVVHRWSLSRVAAAVLPSPATGGAWLANKIVPRGERLEPGQIILAGSFTAPVFARKGDTFHVDYGPLGAIAVRFA